MAKKSIILSNGDGRVTFSNTSSVYIEDSNENIFIDQLTASSITLNNVAGGSQLISSSAGTAGNVPAGQEGGALQWNGSAWVTSSLQVIQYSGSAGGDLAGTYPDPTVVSIANVDSGTLPINHGGTGKSLESSDKSLLLVSGSGVDAVYSTLSGTVSGTILTNVDGQWKFMPPKYAPDVQFFTASGNTYTYTWTKPEGAKMARVVCLGGGGGGARGRSDISPASGGGGGAGGLSDQIIYIENISNALITIGSGGAPGIWGITSSNYYPSSGYGGGNSSFSSSKNYIYAEGGGGGDGVLGLNPATNTVMFTTYDMSGKVAGLGGRGNVGIGGNGATTVGINAPNTYGMPSGGGYGATTTVTASKAGTVSTTYFSMFNYGYSIDKFGNSISITMASGSNGAASAAEVPATPLLYGAGGGGGYASGSNGSQNLGRAASGSAGYVLVISW